MKISKKQEGKPCDIRLKSGVIAHGRIGTVRRGIVSVKGMYIPGVHTTDNGDYVSYFDAKTAEITIY